MAKLRCQRGQATVDYVALIALLALLLAAAATVANIGASGVANAVLGQLRAALCIVSGHSCRVERRACVVRSDRDTTHVAVSIAIVRIDEDRIVLRERMSDRSVRLTVAERDGAGVEAGVGARARVRLGGREFGFEREARGGAQGVFGHGAVYVARNDREADELLRAIRRSERLFGLGGPKPREIFAEGGVRGLGRLGIGGALGGGSLDGIAEAVLGARRDQRSGEVTISLGAGSLGWALLHAVMPGPSGGHEQHADLALKLDRDGRPVELALNASGALGAGATLPAGLAVALRAGSAFQTSTAMDGRRWELSARVDLRDPSVAAAWEAFRDDPTDRATIRALAEQLRERAILDVRSYAVSTDSDGVTGGLSLGVKLGGELDVTRDRATLLTAATRPPGGLWETRLDCVSATPAGPAQQAVA